VVPRLLFLVPAGMMLLALAPLPYGYYQLLRLVTFVAGGIIAAAFWRRGSEGWAVCFAVLALLFNPLIRVYLEREVWMIANLVAAAVFVCGLGAARRISETKTLVRRTDRM
jgi:hypothetical protein